LHLPDLRRKGYTKAFYRLRVLILKHSLFKGLVFIAVALISLLVNAYQSPYLKSDFGVMLSDMVNRRNLSTNVDKRFEKIKKALPVNGHVAYMNNRTLNLIDKSGGLYQTQYSLAPLLVSEVVSGTKIKYEWVIGDFNPPVDVSVVTSRMHLDVNQDYGDGVILFHNAGDSQ